MVQNRRQQIMLMLDQSHGAIERAIYHLKNAQQIYLDAVEPDEIFEPPDDIPMPPKPLSDDDAELMTKSDAQAINPENWRDAYADRAELVAALVGIALTLQDEILAFRNNVV